MPGNWITEFLTQKYQSISHHKIVPPKLCDLKRFDFLNGGPDYRKRLVRDFYFVKYSSAYVTEYFLCYYRIFSTEFLLDRPRICTLSIGCGAMLDLVGFEYARRYWAHVYSGKPVYCGIDVVDWRCEDTKLIDNIKSFYEGLENFSASDFRYPFSIICFPKSLSDIPSESIMDFADSLTEDDVEDKFCIIVSKRRGSTTDSRLGRDFVEILADNLSYTYTQEDRTQILRSDSEYFEHHLDTPFIFDNNIHGFMEELGEQCGHCECEESEDCKNTIGKKAMRKVEHIYPEIYYLEKK